MWYFSGFLKNTQGNEQYSLSYLVFHKGNNPGGMGTASFHIALTNMESKNYYYEIFNPANNENKASDFSENMDIHFNKDVQDLQLKKENP